ncbi:hypothetical protein PCANC_05775 [Puccinia coronata f. sp. avenae]|uniref:Uncharacterized protein n=1 Tax=Puccinia coronata f. sp. avenae TaxID=200324 RepID=A0A2N5VSF4_9BASI|nr:hypothetical protein PCANC_05775 [Puccinia coronata f. sp. avenae]
MFEPYLDGTAADSDSSNVAASPDNPVNATYPFTDLPRVTTPNPRGFFDPDHYHQLESDQIASLLDRALDPARFDRYAFAPQQFTDFYHRSNQLFLVYDPSLSLARSRDCVLGYARVARLVLASAPVVAQLAHRRVVLLDCLFIGTWKNDSQEFANDSQKKARRRAAVSITNFGRRWESSG